MTDYIAQAIEPLRQAAIDNATQKARAFLIKVSDALAANDGDARKAAPYPHGMDSNYMAKKGWHNQVIMCSKDDNKARNNYAAVPKNPDYRKMDFEVSKRFVEKFQQEASIEFDSYVAKLKEKIGEVTSAQVSGDFVWSHSILTVTKEDGSVEKWKTQMIINVSKHGKLFNQFPTRKMK